MAELSRFDVSEITTFLPNPADVARMRAVCKTWRHWVEEPTVNNEIISKFLTNDWSDLFYTAIVRDSVEIAKIALDKAAVISPSYGATQFSFACSRGCENIAKLLISRFSVNYNKGFISAVANGHLNLARMLVAHGADAFDEALFSACENLNYAGAEFAIALGAKDLDLAFIKSCESGFARFVEFLLPEISDIQVLNDGLAQVCGRPFTDGENHTIAHAIIACGADAYDEALEIASESDDNIEFTRFLLSLGAKVELWDFPRPYDSDDSDLEDQTDPLESRSKTVKLILEHGLSISLRCCLVVLSSHDLSIIAPLILSDNFTRFFTEIMEHMHNLEDKIETPEDFDYYTTVMRIIISRAQPKCPVCKNPITWHLNSRPRPPPRPAPRPASPSDD